ncbi:Ldh family oxidoreductase [Rhizobium sp. KVB221]|uniref:Ldh family oxidoreductase n=2 Tax=Rhizobium setariae TaxID=2801340 RepID=A0A936YV00_9HYPH|nr:Ldh family oxidoreductase [Rhizobium setariae]MBL0373951.1 Ldh family oxidoreductase [Rhizobium setariae]
MSTNGSTNIFLPVSDLTDLLTRIFIRNGVSRDSAGILAANCAWCERDGSLSHGIFRMPGYVATLKSGWVDGCAKATTEIAGAAFLRVDAQNGFAQPAWQDSLPQVFKMVSEQGVAVVAIRNSHHFSALWPDLEPLADKGLIALSMVTGLACVAPYGGRRPVFGTNPIAFATPVADAHPMIFDFATSSISNGDLRIAAKSGHQIPPESGIDASGNLSADPSAILSGGALLPFGGHKGAAISLMVEILASGLTGGLFSSEVDFSSHPGAESPRTGQVIIAIDPQRGGNGAFERRVRQLIDTVRDAGQTRLPSDRRYRTRELALSNGIPLSQEQHEALLAMAG